MNQIGKSAMFSMVMVISLLLTGCNLGNTSEDSRKSMIQSVNPDPTAIEDQKGKNYKLAEKVKKDVRSVPAIYDVAVLKGEEEVLVAYKVKHMQRMHMKRIEKEIKQKLEKNYPKENFIVSSDYKIFIEVLELKEKIRDDNNFSKEKAEERLQKIIKFQQELT
ncbi:Sporulation lipoprotein YhcN/YlaJ (Spore_YhcN_YlaJ) [Mesobacillus persicus]|uniref:Sporulation lipoprotein YhcN/YlaJ (Spore_YhcN_YlaJ) n=1 Tax=Mesobacillus persicus TaxID=930146 RepID=A0A1H8E8H7_9BACI|nr:YhcN/YlaJ family sporulation lipoprotein [Mesobacillus persicus]SEN15752.1 Sporulation lipoprotein YhcN/YlaJ (Spore_YhcN_YlaJ) [Mesobacillus persicus]